jgi:hypothetical protein
LYLSLIRTIRICSFFLLTVYLSLLSSCFVSKQNSICFVLYRISKYKILSILYRIEFRYKKYDLYNIVSNFDMIDMQVLTVYTLMKHVFVKSESATATFSMKNIIGRKIGSLIITSFFCHHKKCNE